MAVDDHECAEILVVDDVYSNRMLLAAYLQDASYLVREASNGQQALDAIDEKAPDLILLDIMMPGMTGFEVCERLRAIPGNSLIPVIIQTSLGGSEQKARAAAAGADDFISKPLNKTELLTRVRSLLRIKRLTDALDGAENTILALARALEARDPYTRGHSERVGLYARRLAERMALPCSDQELIRMAGLLHDVGKIGICEAILQKPGSLEPTEWEKMRQHPIIGAEICRPLHSIKSQLPTIRHHHERWDGEGYPDGLSEDQIPLGARITAVCDAWDAMTSDRVYRRGMPTRRAVEILHSGKGAQWDPDVVQMFLQYHGDIVREFDPTEDGDKRHDGRLRRDEEHT